MTDEEISKSIAALMHSDTGRQALIDLLAFLRGPGLSLDGSNKNHWLRLLGAAWGSKAGTVQCMLQEATMPNGRQVSIAPPPWTRTGR